MYVATVIPIARGIPFDTLTYYCSEILFAGTLVSIPLGKQTITGMVVETIPLTEAKTVVKQATFALKKIKAVLGAPSYFEQAVLALRATATQTLAPIGSVAANVMPQFLFEYINSEKVSDLVHAPLSEKPLFEEQVSIGTEVERADYYKRLIRTAFAAKKSVLFVAPTIRSLSHWQTLLSKGIQKHVIVMHSKTTKKNLRSYFSLLKTSERPLLIFATPAYFMLPRSDIGLVIAEDESSSLYKTHDRFAVDIRLFIREFCQRSAITLCWGDILPRFETLERLGQAHLPRTFVPERLHIVPLEHYRTPLPSEVIELLRHAETKKRRLFIYTNRKGIAPLSRCADCGTIVTCPTCTLPMVLRNKVLGGGVRERYFICTNCADTLPTDHTCTYCGSWNITPLAIGTESLHEEIAALVGAESVFTIDDEVTPDSATIETLIRDVQQKKFAVIIGTTKALPYLKDIAYAIIPFFDRLLSIPSLYTTEQSLRLIMECNERVTMGVLVCTRNPEFPFIKQMETQKINAIIEEELAARKILLYPPYGTLIKLSLTVPEGYRQKIKEVVEQFLSALDISPLSARRISPESMKLLMTWIIKVPTTYIEEEGQELVAFLETLRFPYRIEQNPERL